MICWSNNIYAIIEELSLPNLQYWLKILSAHSNIEIRRLAVAQQVIRPARY